MKPNQDEVTATANRVLQKILLNTNVESFGVMHQMPFIEFRNEQADDMHLHFDSSIEFYPQHQVELSRDEKMLVGMNSVNLKLVVKVNCTDTADLEVHFEDGSWFKISGVSDDGYEPWQVSNGISTADGGILLVALSEGGYAIWDGSIDSKN